jgi:uncharacterized protein (DUF433 family)
LVRGYQGSLDCGNSFDALEAFVSLFVSPFSVNVAGSGLPGRPEVALGGALEEVGKKIGGQLHVLRYTLGWQADVADVAAGTTNACKAALQRAVTGCCWPRSGFAENHPAPYGDRSGMTDRIVIDPKVCHGRPVVRGTRMPVSLIVGSLAGGMSFEDVQREYALTLENIRAALKFAGELVEQEQ